MSTLKKAIEANRAKQAKKKLELESLKEKYVTDSKATYAKQDEEKAEFIARITFDLIEVKLSKA